VFAVVLTSDIAQDASPRPRRGSAGPDAHRGTRARGHRACGSRTNPAWPAAPLHRWGCRCLSARQQWARASATFSSGT
jgi:hypothetical protein